METLYRLSYWGEQPTTIHGDGGRDEIPEPRSPAPSDHVHHPGGAITRRPRLVMAPPAWWWGAASAAAPRAGGPEWVTRSQEGSPANGDRTAMGAGGPSCRPVPHEGRPPPVRREQGPPHASTRRRRGPSSNRGAATTPQPVRPPGHPPRPSPGRSGHPQVSTPASTPRGWPDQGGERDIRGRADGTRTAPDHGGSRGRCAWQVLDSNQRRLSRRIYSPLPLAARATCRGRRPRSTAGRIAQTYRPSPNRPEVCTWPASPRSTW